MSHEPRPYNQVEYEEQLAAAERQDFPEAPFSEPASRVSEVPPGFTGIIPRGAEPSWAEVALNDKDKLDKETAWHHLSNPHKPLTARHKEFCRLVARGLPYSSPGGICELLGYSITYASLLSAHPKMRAEVDRVQTMQLEASIDERMKSVNHRAFDVVEEMITDPGTKDSLRFDAARWLLEKTTGKAAQKIETKDQNLGDFMSLLRESMEQRKLSGEKAPQTADLDIPDYIDVTPPPTAEPERDSLADWVARET